MSGVYYIIVEDERGATLADMAAAGAANPIPPPCADPTVANWDDPSKMRPGSVPVSRDGAGREDVTEQLRIASADVARSDLDMNSAPQYDPTGLADAKGTLPLLKARGRQHTAVLLKSILTPDECAGVVAKALPYLWGVDTQYAQHTRQCQRALMRMPLFAADLFARLVPHLKPTDYEDRIPLCFGQGGVWRPVGLNEVVKVMSYSGGRDEHFAPHRDGPWLPREDQASIFTVIVYLNDDFTFGFTELLGEHTASSYRFRGPTGLAVTPVQGMGLLFNHDCIHAGGRVKGPGQTKFVLRTEMIFERVAPTASLAGSALDRYCHVASTGFAECLKRYRAAHALCDKGDREGFMAEYQQVILQQRAAAEAAVEELASAVETKSPACALFPAIEGFRIRGLNADALGDVLRYVDDVDLLSVMAASAAAYHAVVTSPMWRMRTVDRFGNALTKALKAAAPAAVSDAVPWLAVYRQQRAWECRFAPATLWPLTCGSILSTPACLPENESFNRTGDRLYGIGDARNVPSGRLSYRLSQLPAREKVRGRDLVQFDVVVDDVGDLHRVVHHRLPDLFGGLHFSFPMHVNMPNEDRYTIGYARRHPKHPSLHMIDSSIATVCSPTGMTELSVLIGALDTVYDTPWTPLVLVDHPQWGLPVTAELRPDVPRSSTTETKKRPSTDMKVRPIAKMREIHVHDCMEVFRAPAVCCLSISECVVARLANQLGVAADEVSCDVLMCFTSGFTYIPTGSRGSNANAGYGSSPAGAKEVAGESPYSRTWAYLAIRDGRALPRCRNPAVTASDALRAAAESLLPSAEVGSTPPPPGQSSQPDEWTPLPGGDRFAQWGDLLDADAATDARGLRAPLVLILHAAEGDEASAHVTLRGALEQAVRGRQVLTMNTAGVARGAAIVASEPDFRSRCVFRHSVDVSPPPMFR